MTNMRATLLLATAIAMASAEPMHVASYYEEKFFNWLNEHNVKPESGLHFVRMLRAFTSNDDFITQHNRGTSSFTLAHNRFSGLTNEEFRSFLKLQTRAPKAAAAFLHEGHHIADDDSVDWTEHGAVTDVKDQGQCGSCWAFSTTGAIEGAFAIKTGYLESFSEQYFVDCDTVDHGCEGGLMDQAFQWAHDNGGVALEKDYKYTGADGECDTKVKTVAAAAPASFTDVKPNSDDAMMSAITKQPVSIAIDAGRLTFQLYNKGVYDDPLCGTRLNHGVLAVGYGTQSGKDYYKVKNSWGAFWGDKGYILLARGGDVDNDKGGQCGMLKEGSYPNLA